MPILILVGYPVVMLLLGAGVLVLPAWNGQLWGAIGLLSAVAVAVGAWRNAPARRLPWWLLSASLLAMTVGDFDYGVSAADGVLPLISNVCYLLSIPLIMAAFVVLTRASTVLKDRARLLDLLIVACAAGLVSWVFLISPSLNSAVLAGTDRSVMAVSIIGDLIILIACLRLALAARRSWSVILLLVGSLGTFLGDLGFTISQLGGGWHPGDPSELGYLVFYGAWGAAALHPSMIELTAPVQARPGRLGGGATALIRASLVVPAGTLLVEALTGRIHDLLVIAVISIIMCQLVITRFADTVEKHRRSLARESGLREACGTLVGAVAVDEIKAAVRGAVERLMPSGVDHVLVLSLHDEQSAAGTSSTIHGDHLSDLVVSSAFADQGAGNRPAAGRRSRLLSTSMFPTLHADIGRFPTVLVCPLTADLGAHGGGADGALFLAARGKALTTIRDAMEVLATQTTMALDRIALSNAIHRDDGERYLRTVVRNTTDVVLIVEDNDRIRYASPSLTTVLGVEPPPDAGLTDIVHHDHHEQLVRAMEQAGRSSDATGIRDTWTLRRADGGRVEVEVGIRDLRQDAMVRGFVITMRDASRQREREQELIRRALRGSGGWQNRRSSRSRFRHE